MDTWPGNRTEVLKFMYSVPLPDSSPPPPPLSPSPVVTYNQATISMWSVSPMPRAPTWPLLAGAGDDPLDQAALHQRFSGESGSLPLGVLGLPVLVWIFPVSVGNADAVHHLVSGLSE